ncbi:hypothetical protein Nepgr_010509 [Nepenthes gracilis]|uniref:F-box domain-containing protein n=1 Tax=Nepenthes gracilis TaxID=150966 RepID=A0AAD3XLE4_NEPGR|nr:hypothetical protein Nepgr_010509 [Nepenthes gracilis]
MNSFDPREGVFPDEVMLMILARLPIKSLFRFKSVCRLWCKLPSERYFVQLYSQLSAKNPLVLVEDCMVKISKPKSSLICVDCLQGASELSLDFLKDRVKIKASCNGLLCCSSIPDRGVYYVCNPMTREYKLLPKSREGPVTRFYPDGEATLVGIACDFSSQKFNVVLAGYHRCFGHRPDKTFLCKVYDSGTNKWREFMSVQDDYFSQMNRNQVVFVNGALHWLTVNCSCILVLDLDYDVWRKIHLPDGMVYGIGCRLYLLELEGRVSVIHISDAWMSIWVLTYYAKEEWEMVDRVSLRCIGGMVPGIFPICQTGEYVFLATHKQVLVYHRMNRVWKEMYAVKNSSTQPLWFSAHAFRSSIFSFH